MGAEFAQTPAKARIPRLHPEQNYAGTPASILNPGRKLNVLNGRGEGIGGVPVVPWAVQMKGRRREDQVTQ
jgi:hypothetical protein